MGAMWGEKVQKVSGGGRRSYVLRDHSIPGAWPQVRSFPAVPDQALDSRLYKSRTPNVMERLSSKDRDAI
jgi:hypothetical protein